MADQEIKDLKRGCVQASLMRVQTFVQQYEESQDVLNINLLETDFFLNVSTPCI
jgi:hypothetical protein